MYPLIPYLFKILFVGDYVKGSVVAPYLYLSPLLLMLFQVVANQFLVISKSYLATVSLSLGAIINIILNFILIRKMGIEGAAIATLTGYLFTIITVMIISIQNKCMRYAKRSIIVLLIIPLYFIVQRIFLVDSILAQFLFMGSVLIFLLAVYKDDLYINRRKS